MVYYSEIINKRSGCVGCFLLRGFINVSAGGRTDGSERRAKNLVAQESKFDTKTNDTQMRWEHTHEASFLSIRPTINTIQQSWLLKLWVSNLWMEVYGIVLVKHSRAFQTRIWALDFNTTATFHRAPSEQMIMDAVSISLLEMESSLENTFYPI
jgi:hypothetical protein